MNHPDIILDRSESHISLLFPEDYMYIGTPIFGDGMGLTRRIINLKVDENYEDTGTVFEPPAETLGAFATRKGWKEPAIGFMTSASMNSYTADRKSFEGLKVETHLTSGLSNARAAGDKVEFRNLLVKKPPAGTINMFIILNMPLTNQAAIEGLMIAAGAKARALLELGVKSRVSDAAATGTGTDSTAILYPPARPPSEPIGFAGMHTITGELIALSVIEALKKSIAKYI